MALRQTVDRCQGLFVHAKSTPTHLTRVSYSSCLPPLARLPLTTDPFQYVHNTRDISHDGISIEYSKSAKSVKFMKIYEVYRGIHLWLYMTFIIKSMEN